MIDTATPQPVKARITHGQLVRWQQEAAGFVEVGESPAVIHAWLQEQGCPPRMRDEVLRKARESVRGEHRGIGLKLFAAGAVGTGLGVSAIVGSARAAFSNDGQHAYGAGYFGVKLAIGLLFLSVPPLVYGGWKLLTGSTVTPPER